MSTGASRVRHLRLQAPSDALVRRGALLLEDALRTASLADADAGRLLLVRRLDVDVIRPGASPAALSLSLERRLRAVSSAAVPADAPGAGAAPAVWFSDAVEAHVALLRRLVAADGATEWFWTAAVPAWQPWLGRGDALRIVLAELMAHEGGPAAVAALLTSLARAGRADPLLASLAPADGDALLRMSGWRAVDLPASATARAAGTSVAHGATAEGAALLATWVKRWGRADTRSAWLAASLLVGEMPLRLLEPHLMERAAAWIGALEGNPRKAAAAADRRGLRPDPAPGDPGGAASIAAPERVRPPASASTRAAPRSAGAVSAPNDPPPTATYEPDPAPAGVEDGWQVTCAAGLLFLVPVLERLGAGEAVTADRRLIEAELPRRILERVAERLRVPPRDPMLLALAGSPEEPPATLPADVARLRDEWVRSVRRHVRQLTGAGLGTVTLRPGHVAASRTHIDVRLALATADIRVRRAGMDIDPGWVPWLGRVVRFHYGVDPDA